jgi:hypothetical protein
MFQLFVNAETTYVSRISDKCSFYDGISLDMMLLKLFHGTFGTCCEGSCSCGMSSALDIRLLRYREEKREVR